MSGRRDALKIIGAIGATCAHPFGADELYGQHVHADPAGAAPPAAPQFFTEDEFADLAVLADLIIPPTGTPGAAAAGVPAYIDALVLREARFQRTYRNGIAWLNAEARKRHTRKFSALALEQQIAMLTPLCEQADAAAGNPASRGKTRRRALPPEVEFFRALKSMTADGYYTSKIGLAGELRYAGNTVLEQFPACTHEH